MCTISILFLCSFVLCSANLPPPPQSQGNKKAQKRNKKARDAVVLQHAVVHNTPKTFTGMSATDLESSRHDLYKIIHDDSTATLQYTLNMGDIVRAGTFPLPCTHCGFLRNIGEFTPLPCACDWYANGNKNIFFPKKKVECGACRKLRFNNGKFVACHCVTRARDYCLAQGPEHWRYPMFCHHYVMPLVI